MITARKLKTCIPPLLLSVLFASIAAAGTYSISAHGNSVHGVKRSEGSVPMPDAYVAGNCSHCHSPHNSLDGQEHSAANSGPSPFNLFAKTFNTNNTSDDTNKSGYQQSEVFCFYCHTDSGSFQASSGSMVNKDYAATFAGTPDGATSIMAQFNQVTTGGSNHNLYGMWDYMKEHPQYGKKNGGWFSEDSSPCVACHNPHLARQNKENLTNASYATISRPSQHFEQWGDNSDEQMSDYTAIYQAPFYAYSGDHPTDVNTAFYEPAGVALALADGQLTPDYNTFCLDCHKEAISSYSLKRDLIAIDWATERHGMPNAVEVFSRTPYGRQGGYVLSCLDCHEAHGSPNELLIRRSINGVAVGPVGVVPGDRGNQCRQCHMDDNAWNQGSVNSWKYSHHGRGKDSPYKGGDPPGCGCHNYDGKHKAPDPIPCEICHYHGSFVPNPAGKFPSTLSPKSAPFYRKMF